MSDFITTLWRELGSPEVTTASAAVKLFVSMILGGLIGLERKLKGQSAGVRTFALICMEIGRASCRERVCQLV